MNTKTKSSAMMKRNGRFMMLAAAISLTLVCSTWDDRRADNAIAVNAPTSTVVVDAQQSEQRRTSSGSSIVGDSQTLLHDAPVVAVPQALQTSATAPVAMLSGPPAAAQGFDTSNPDDTERNHSEPRNKMSGPVAALLASGASGDAELVVRYDQHPQLFDDEFVAELGGEVTRSYEHLDMRAIRVPVAALESLAADENVAWMSLDDDMSATSVSSRLA
ncbi:MAG: hypothetical protein AAFN50_10840, partial [Pseudomonadota bacterium]